jgi:hypothetical protein
MRISANQYRKQQRIWDHAHSPCPDHCPPVDGHIPRLTDLNPRRKGSLMLFAARQVVRQAPLRQAILSGHFKIMRSLADAEDDDGFVVEAVLLSLES